MEKFKKPVEKNRGFFDILQKKRLSQAKEKKLLPVEK